MELIYLVIGLAIGAVLSFLYMHSRSGTASAMLEREKSGRNADASIHAKEIEMLKIKCASEIQASKAEAKRMADFSRQQYEQSIAELNSHWSQRTEEMRSRIQEIKADCQKRVDNMQEALEKEKERHQKELYFEKEDAAAQREKEIEALKRSYQDQMSLFKEQVTTATETLLKSRSGELQEQNTRTMEELFSPIKDNIKRMEQSMMDTREANARNTASFEKTIQQMMEANARLGSQADRLSTALMHKNKTAGNWGELILSELLESQGLVEGEHFSVQQTLKDEAGNSLRHEDTGARMIPDVVLHLADKRDVVIDSKMSLTAFIDYQNAETEEERADALKRHIASVKAHVNELTAKKYNEYIKTPHVSIDFVIMFVPIDGALQLALNENPELWREAFDKKVFIATGQTLIAALRIIDLTWVNVKQERNTRNVMDEARKLIDRVNSFYTSFKTVGTKLEDAAKAYTEVTKKVEDGRTSILAAGRRMEALGARGKKPLPADPYSTGPFSDEEPTDDTEA